VERTKLERIEADEHFFESEVCNEISDGNPMAKNPLTPIVIVLVLGDAYTIKELVDGRPFDAFIAMALVQCAVLIYLYLKKSRSAGTFLFLSMLVFFPAYFGLKALGLNPPPTTGAVYSIAFIIYAAAVAACWNLKKKYDRYLLATEQPSSSNRMNIGQS
jgi:hypothetical protein